MNLKMTAAGLLLATAPIAAFSSQGSQNGLQGPEPALIYDALDVLEFRVAFLDPDTGMPRLGVDVFEKAVGGLLCRRTAPVVPEPEFDYRCYLQRRLSDGKAMVVFSLLKVAPVEVRYLDPATGAPRVGTTALEKAKGGLLCQRTEAVVPEPVPSYTCYRDMELDATELGTVQGRARAEERRRQEDR